MQYFIEAFLGKDSLMEKNDMQKRESRYAKKCRGVIESTRLAKSISHMNKKIHFPYGDGLKICCYSVYCTQYIVGDV